MGVWGKRGGHEKAQGSEMVKPVQSKEPKSVNFVFGYVFLFE